MREREIVIRIKLPESPRKRWLLGGIVAILGLSAVAYAAFPTPPYPVPAFSSGSPLSSSMASGYINGLDSRVGSLEAGAKALAVVVNSDGTLLRQIGTWVASTTRNGVGDYTINLASGTFSATPICTATIQAANTALNAGMTKISTDAGPSTTTIRVTTANTSGALVDIAVEVVCVGLR